MRSFYQNDDEDEFRDGYFMEEDDDGPSDVEEVGFAQIDLIDKKLNQNLLNEAINLLSKSFFWKFKSLDSKLEMIEETYQKLHTLVERTGIEE